MLFRYGTGTSDRAAAQPRHQLVHARRHGHGLQADDEYPTFRHVQRTHQPGRHDGDYGCRRYSYTGTLRPSDDIPMGAGIADGANRQRGRAQRHVEIDVYLARCDLGHHARAIDRQRAMKPYRPVKQPLRRGWCFGIQAPSENSVDGSRRDSKEANP